MNNWLWALPLVAFAVWIVSNLIKNAQDEARRRDNRPRPPGAEQSASGQRQPPPVRKIERPRPPVRPQPPPQLPPRPQQERSRPPLRVPPAEPVRTVRRPEAAVEQIVVGQLVETAAIAAPAPAVAPTVTSTGRKPTRAVQTLYALLKNKNTQASAFLLTEVFGKPRCKKQ